MHGAAPMVADGGEAKTVVDGREATHDLVEEVRVELRPAGSAVTWMWMGAAPPPANDLVGKVPH